MARTILKRSVGLRDDLIGPIENAAAEDGLSVSAWLNEAAEQKLLLREMAQAVAKHEQESGPITELELARARKRFGRLS